MKGGKGGTGEEGKRTIAAVSTIGVESPYVHNIINEGKRMDHDDQDLHKEGTQQPRQNERLHTHTHNTQAPPEHTPFEFLARVLMRNDGCSCEMMVALRTYAEMCGVAISRAYLYTYQTTHSSTICSNFKYAGSLARQGGGNTASTCCASYTVFFLFCLLLTAGSFCLRRGDKTDCRLNPSSIQKNLHTQLYRNMCWRIAVVACSILACVC